MRSSEPEEATLDTLLHEQNDYLADDGFTAGVMAVLPHRRRRTFQRLLLLSSTAAGVCLAFIWLPWRNLPALDYAIPQSLSIEILLPWIAVLTVLGVLIKNGLNMLRMED
jgi:hypothetical protein